LKPTRSYRLARLRDALLLTLCTAATTIAVILGILMAWNVDVLNTVLDGGSVPWLVGSCLCAVGGWAGYALQRPPGAPDDDR